MEHCRIILEYPKGRKFFTIYKTEDLDDIKVKIYNELNDSPYTDWIGYLELRDDTDTVYTDSDQFRDNDVVRVECRFPVNYVTNDKRAAEILKSWGISPDTVMVAPDRPGHWAVS